MIERTKDRREVTLIELLVVVLIISIVAALAQPRLSHLIVKARAADAISDMQAVRMAVYNYQTDQQEWPDEMGPGIMPEGLDEHLPDGFNILKEDFTLDFENWGGSPYMIGVALITSDPTLGLTALEMLASPKWTLGDKYTWVIE